MLRRFFVALTLFAVVQTQIVAEDSSLNVEIGDKVIIRMTRDFAFEYLRKSGMITATDRQEHITIERYGEVIAKSQNQIFLIKHSCRIKCQDRPLRMVEITVFANSNEIVRGGEKNYLQFQRSDVEYVSLERPPIRVADAYHLTNNPIASAKWNLSTFEKKDLNLNRIELSELKESVSLEVWELLE